MAFILKNLTSANQIATTNMVLKLYQKILWVISKKLEPETATMPNIHILRILTIKNEAKDKRIRFILFLISIFGVERFKIRRR